MKMKLATIAGISVIAIASTVYAVQIYNTPAPIDVISEHAVKTMTDKERQEFMEARQQPIEGEMPEGMPEGERPEGMLEGERPEGRSER
ncbi:MAG: hypothetical protein BEN19_02875 [Epulopiscium sp. Nuni2H_MBin003]|nr:MAG: hypothetical protein BEN19_02875 [Epulopiscium sp. Nuni2H_MBin003]